MNKFNTSMTIRDLKRIIAYMDDDAIVSARDRDCISLDQVHVVNHPTMNESNDDGYNLRFVKSIDKVYGGRGMELDNKSKQAIIFCDCD